VDALSELRQLAARNNVATTMIGQGYYGTSRRRDRPPAGLENPAWYTAYTPYQPEISQGRLEGTAELPDRRVRPVPAWPTANASLLDEGTAAAEADDAGAPVNKKSKKQPLPVERRLLAQSDRGGSDRAEALDLEVVVADTTDGLPDGRLLRVPGAVTRASGGVVRDSEAVGCRCP